MAQTHWVDLKIPWLPWLVQIDGHFFEVQTELGQRNVCTVGPGTVVVSVPFAS
jgi:hypothetical protein